jgi:hypothetical protein
MKLIGLLAKATQITSLTYRLVFTSVMLYQLIKTASKK